MDEPLANPASVIPAATVVVFRRASTGGPPQLLMLQRAQEMRFAGGAAVFPGGRVDPADRELAARLMPDADPEDAAARIAAVRETLEESGLAIALARPVSGSEAADARAFLHEVGTLSAVLDRFAWTITPDALVPFARWCPMQAGSFDTRFYLADLGTGAVDVAVDATENTHLFWASAAEALRMDDEGHISVIFPTRRNLERLAQYTSFANACDHAAAHPVRLITPFREMRGGAEHLCIPEAMGYPVTSQPMTTAKRALPS